MDDAFGNGEPFRVGIEEELFLVDLETRRLRPVAAEVLSAMNKPEQSAAHEAFAAEIELRSAPSANAGEAVAELGRLRAATLEAAAGAGATLAGAGLHPAADFGDAELVDAERYRKVLDDVRGLIQRTPECALHVHISMPDRETAVRAYNGLRGWLPLLGGLAGSSAFWFGRDSGLASARAAMIRSYPGRGIPRALRDWEDFERALADTRAGGGPPDYTHVWWEVRLHPRFGTVEVRELDAQARLGDVGAIAALVQGLARHEAEAGAEPLATETVHWSAWRAIRDGIGAEIHHEGRLAPLPEVARAAIAIAERHAREAGGVDALGDLELILDEGAGADRQRAAHAAAGMEGLLDSLVAETAPPM
jgi:glutamate---cysteine ligase / carboxylate-amine ligase